MTKIEEIARLIDPRVWHQGGPMMMGRRDRAMTKARAVLSALKPPTPAMIEDGQAVDGTITAEEVYRAMIAAVDDGGR